MGRKAKVSRGSPWVQLVAGIVGSTTDDLTDRIAKDERRRLQSMAAVAMVIAMAVGASAVVAWNQRNEARDQRNKAIAMGLTSEGEAMLADMKGGGDVRALKEILAAPHVAPSADAGAQFSAAVELANTIRIIETRDGVNSSYSRRNFDEAERIETALEKFPLPRDIRNRLGRRHLHHLDHAVGRRRAIPCGFSRHGLRDGVRVWPPRVVTEPRNRISPAPR